VQSTPRILQLSVLLPVSLPSQKRWAFGGSWRASPQLPGCHAGQPGFQRAGTVYAGSDVLSPEPTEQHHINH